MSAAYRRLFLRGTLSLLIIAAGGQGAFAKPAFPLPGRSSVKVVDFEKYGTFVDAGTEKFHYVVKNKAGLSKALGWGIDPQTTPRPVPALEKLRKRGAIHSHWRHVGSGDTEADFYAWAVAPEESGVRLLFLGKALEAGGHFYEALKAYRASMIFYPQSAGWSADGKYAWSSASAAMGAAISLVRRRPEMNLDLTGNSVKVNYDGPKKFTVSLAPGRLVPRQTFARVSLDSLKVIEKRGDGRVQIVKYENGHWGMRVDGRPFVVKSVSYHPTKIGTHISQWNWMEADENNNGLNDPGLESWVDANRNDKRDPDEPTVGDFNLMKDMGANAVRVMAHQSLNTSILRKMHEISGLFAFVCEPLGAYTVHSGAEWEKGTDYTDPVQRRNMLDALRTLVLQVKDEPWLLAYVLGNENNMEATFQGVNATRTNASVHPEAYASLLEEAAKIIHSLDPNHPVGVGNLETGMLDVYARLAPSLDFLGINSYRGKDGFGALWIESKSLFDRPILITEFGSDAYKDGVGPDEEGQAAYVTGNWEDISFNSAGAPGAGNALGGNVFEWLDEWWKDTRNNDWAVHDRAAVSAMPFSDGWSHEEWYGLASQGGAHSPFQRVLRKSYFDLKGLWMKSEQVPESAAPRGDVFVEKFRRKR